MDISVEHRIEQLEAELAALKRENEALRVELSDTRATQMPADDRDAVRWLADALPIIVWRADIHDQVEFLNLAWVTYTGVPSRASIARTPGSFVHPDDLPLLVDRRRRSLETGETMTFEYRLLRADGTYRWHLARLVPEKDAEGRVCRWYGSATDIQDLKETEARLATAEERARAIVEQAMFSVQLLEPDGRTRFVNREWEKLWGITLADLHAIDYNMRTDAQLEARGVMPYIQMGFAGEATAIPIIQYDTTQSDLGGSDVYVRGYIYPVRDADGEIREVVVMHQDVTAQVLSEQALQDANARLTAQATVLEAEVERRTADLQALNQALAAQKALTERIIYHAPVAMAYFDADLIYRWNNPRHCEVMGLPAEDIVGRSVREVMPSRTLAHTEPIYQTVLRTGEAQERLAIPARVGDTFWDCSYIPVLGDDGVVQGVLTLAVDATLRLANERLREAQIAALRDADRAKDEFLSVISHELRTPLNFIMGFASTLEDQVQGPLNEAQLTATRRIMHGSERMLALVNDLLDFAKLQSGKFDLSRQRTAYAPVVDEVVALLQPLADQRGHSVTVEVDVAQEAHMDGARVAQVLTNLLSNAIKFTPDGGQIHIRVVEQDGRLLTEVTDTGIGIAADDVSKLFHRFKQLDMGNTRHASGTGLGLAIAKALTEAHGGTIGLRSTPGVGSTFWFALPLEET